MIEPHEDGSFWMDCTVDDNVDTLVVRRFYDDRDKPELVYFGIIHAAPNGEITCTSAILPGADVIEAIRLALNSS